MAFGGFFGGGSNGSPSSSSSSDTSSSSSAAPSNLSAFSNASSAQPPSEIRQKIQAAIAMQSSVENAKFLIQKVNENCFEHCIPVPGSSLSSKEQTCLSSCMEKYIEAWNLTSRTYNTRLHRDSLAAGGPGLAGAAGGSKELF
jgi:import inner membrane translocase subunit TIM13